jgi:hypothetical protein
MRGGNTHHQPSSCRKKKIVRVPHLSCQRREYSGRAVPWGIQGRSRNGRKAARSAPARACDPMRIRHAQVEYAITEGSGSVMRVD